jgi:hypothetical protein
MNKKRSSGLPWLSILPNSREKVLLLLILHRFENRLYLVFQLRTRPPLARCSSLALAMAL